MNRRGNLTNVLTHLQEHNSYKLLTHNTNNATAHDARTQKTLYAFPTHNRYGHHGNSAASLEYTHTSLLWVIKKYTSQTLLSTLLFQDVMVQLTVPLPILLTSFIL